MAMKTYISVLIDFHKNQKGMLHNAWELAPFGRVKWWNLLSFSFKATDCLLTDENLGLIEPGISILLIFSVFVDEILKGKPWDKKNTHSIVCLFQCRIPQQAMGLMNCFQEKICVYVCLDFEDKVYDYFFFFYTERNKQYLSGTATQLSNKMDFKAKMHVQGSQNTSDFPSAAQGISICISSHKHEAVAELWHIPISSDTAHGGNALAMTGIVNAGAQYLRLVKINGRA